MSLITLSDEETAELRRLKREADDAATQRGHELIWFVPYLSDGSTNQRGDCAKCNRIALIRTKPQANETDISGEAVAVSCT